MPIKARSNVPTIIVSRCPWFFYRKQFFRFLSYCFRFQRREKQETAFQLPTIIVSRYPWFFYTKNLWFSFLLCPISPARNIRRNDLPKRLYRIALLTAIVVWEKTFRSHYSLSCVRWEKWQTIITAQIWRRYWSLFSRTESVYRSVQKRRERSQRPSSGGERRHIPGGAANGRDEDGNCPTRRASPSDGDRNNERGNRTMRKRFKGSPGGWTNCRRASFLLRYRAPIFFFFAR